MLFLVIPTENALGEIISQRIVYDDGKELERFFTGGILVRTRLEDLSNVESYTFVEQTYDSAGNVITKTVQEDGGDQIVDTFDTTGNLIARTDTDADNSENWETLKRTYDAAGNQLTRDLTFDDGLVYLTTFSGGLRTSTRLTDGGDDNPWDKIENEFDAAGNIIRQTYNFDTGVTVTKAFASSGALLTRELTLDSGRIIFETYDPATGNTISTRQTDAADDVTWDVIETDYDAAGDIIRKTVIKDSGVTVTVEYSGGVETSRTVTDPSAGQPGGPNYAEIHFEFDAAGNIERSITQLANGDTRTVEFAGGAQVNRLLEDTDNDAGWTSINTLFNVVGQRTQVDIIYDDGSVVVDRRINIAPEAQDFTFSDPRLNEDEPVTDTIPPIVISDADGDAISIQSLDTSALLGSLTDNGGGSFTYDPNGEFESLAVGETATTRFTYTVVDSYSGPLTPTRTIGFGAMDTGTVTLEIEGRNDPVTAVTDSASASEDGLSILPNVLANDTDVDASDTLSVTANDTLSTLGAVISVAANGAATYNASGAAAIQAIAAGATLNDTFTYTVSDGNGSSDTATVTITVTGENDAAVFSGLDTLSVREDGQLEDSINVTVSDPDIGESALRSETINSLFGVFEIQSDGTIEYSLDNNLEAVQQLDDGEQLQDSATITSLDGETALVQVEIDGRDETAGQVVAATLQLDAVTGGTEGTPLTAALSFSGTIVGLEAVDRATLEVLVGAGTIVLDLLPVVGPSGAFSVEQSQVAAAAADQGIALEDGLFQAKVVLLSDGDLVQSGSVTGLRDATSPELVSQPQSADFTERAPDRLLLSFDEPVDPLSLALDDIALTDGNGAPITVGSVIANGPSGIQINLSGALPAGSYTLSIFGEGIADAAENRTTVDTPIPFDVAAPTRVISLSPSNDTDLVNLDRKVTMHFDRPVDADTITEDSVQILAPDGSQIDGTLRVSSNGLKVSFFLAEGVLLPASSTVRVLIDGEEIRDAAGQRIDADGDGIAGGISITDFETVSITPVPGTNIEGFIFDSNRRGPDGEDIPLEGVVVSVVGLPGASTVTDAAGRFFLEDLPVPDAFLEFDATSVEAETGFRYGTVTKPAHTTAGQTTRLALTDGTPFNIYLASLSTEDAVALNQDSETTIGVGADGIANLTNLFPDIDPAEWTKLTVTVPEDSLFFDDGTPASEATILAFQPDRIPAPLPQGYDPDFVFTLTAGGAKNFDSNAEVTFPNLTGLPPGARRPILSFDHDAGKWKQTGTAVVSEDGSVLTTEGEGGVNTLGWKFLGPTATSQHTEGPSAIAPPVSSGGSGPSVPPNIQPSPIGLPDNRLAGVLAAGEEAINAGRNTFAASGQAGLAVAAAIDAAIPTETAPNPADAALATAQGVASVVITVVDPDTTLDRKAVNNAIGGTIGSLLPVVDGAVSAESAYDNGKGAITNALQSGRNLQAVAGNLFYAATADAPSEIFGELAIEIAENGPIGPSAQDINRALNPDAFPDQNRIAPQFIPEPELKSPEASRVAFSGDVPFQFAASAAGHVLLPLAEDTITAATEQLIAAGRLANITGTQALQSYLIRDGARISAELDPDGAAATAVDDALSEIAGLMPAFDQAISEAADAFRAAVMAIDIDTLEQAEAVRAFQAAQTAYAGAVQTAFDTFNTQWAQLAEDVDAAIVLTLEATRALTLDVSDLLEVFSDFLTRQTEFVGKAEDLVQALQASDASTQSLTQIRADALALIQEISAFEADLEAAGFTSIADFAERVVDASGSAGKQANLSLVPFTDSYNPLFAQAILDDGTVVRARLAPGEDFSVNGPVGTDAVIRFFDAATNLFSERTITFGEDNTSGELLLSVVLTEDRDGDGIPDLGEEVIGTNPDLADSDGDGTLDGVEVRTGGVSAGNAGTLPTGIVGSVAVSGEAQDVVVLPSASAPGQSVALVAAGSGGLAIVDVGQSTAPSLIRQITLTGDAVSVAVDPTTGLALVAAGEAGLHVVDVSTPATPLLLRTILDAGPVNTVEALGGPVVVGGDASLAIVDPASGTVLDLVVIDGPSRDVSVDDVMVVGDIVYVTERGPRIDIVGERFALDATLVTYRIDAARLIELDRIALPVPDERKLTPEPFKIFVDGTTAYVSTGLEVSEVSDFRPLERGGYLTVSVADPEALSLISSVDTGENQAGNFETVSNGSGVAVVAAGSFGVQLFNASDSQNTFDPITGFDTPGDARGVTLADGLAYVADGAAGLQIVNIISEGANNTAPEVSIALPGSVDFDPVAEGVQVASGTTIPLIMNLVDDGQINRISVIVDGVVQTVLLNPPFIPTAFAPSLGEGEASRSVSIQVSAQDAGGLVTRSAPVTVEIVQDLVGPAVESINLIEGQSLLPGRATTVQVVFDSLVAAQSVTPDLLTVLPATGQPVEARSVTLQSQANGKSAAIFTVEGLPVGDYTFQFDPTGITDLSGNLSTETLISRSATVEDFTNVWSARLDGVWNDVSNWSAGVLPDSGDRVLVDVSAGVTAVMEAEADPVGTLQVTGPGTFEVDVTGPFTIFEAENLINDGNTVLRDGRVTLQDGFVNDGTLEIVGGAVLDFEGNDIINSGTIRIASGTFDGDRTGNGAVDLTSSNITLSGDGILDFDTAAPFNQMISGISEPGIQTFTNSDNTITGTGKIGPDFGFVNDTGGVLRAGAGDTLTVAVSSFDNRGLVVAEAGGEIVLDSEQFLGSPFAFRSSGTLENFNGVFEANGGIIDLTDTLVRGGTFRSSEVDGQSGLIRIGVDSANFGPNFIGFEGVLASVEAEADFEVIGNISITGNLDNTGTMRLLDGAVIDAGSFFFEFKFTQLLGGGTIAMEAGSVIEIGAGFSDFEDPGDSGDPDDGGEPDFSNKVLVEAGSLNIVAHTIEGAGLIGIEDVETYLSEEVGFDDFFPEDLVDASLYDPDTFEGDFFEVQATRLLDVSVLNESRIIANDPHEALTISNASLFVLGEMIADGATMEFINGDIFNRGDMIVQNGGEMRYTVVNSYLGFENLFNDGDITVLDGDFSTDVELLNTGNVSILSGSAFFGNGIASFDDFDNGIPADFLIGDADVEIWGAVNANTLIDFGAGAAVLKLDDGSTFEGNIVSFSDDDEIQFNSLDADFATLSVTRDGDDLLLSVNDGASVFATRLIGSADLITGDPSDAFDLFNQDGMATLTTSIEAPDS